MSNLTEMEAQVVAAAIRATGKTREELAQDNDSWTDVTELAKATGLTVPTVKGVVGSLVNKGVMAADPNSETGETDIVLEGRWLELGA